MLDSIFGTETLVQVTCCQCGVLFGLANGHYKELVNSRKSFHCPNGHQQHFNGPSDAEKLKRANEQLAREREDHERVRRERRTAEIQLKGTKTRLRNLKERVANGVCPCCRRQFGNLRQHMAHMHPQFKATLPEAKG